MKRICHLTSAHSANDVRIFHKECLTLADAGYEVHLIAKGEIPADCGVIHHDLSASSASGRLGRMLFRALKAYRIALGVNADIYHFHDPELLPYGLLLKWRGKRVIYDAHEDVPRDILSKHWIPAWLRRPIAYVFEHLEDFVARRVDLVIAATPHIAKRFAAIGCAATNINNFPLTNELVASSAVSASSGDEAVCYVGGISKDRGLSEMIEALSFTRARLRLAGSFSPASLLESVAGLEGWRRVQFDGLVNRRELPAIFASCMAGLVLFHPEPNYVHAQPNKLFEYMSAGLPVIASDFPLWREIIDGYGCGICVDPLDPKAIGQAIEWICSHPDEARKMGQKGREAVLARYHWGIERERLLEVYSSLG